MLLTLRCPVIDPEESISLPMKETKRGQSPSLAERIDAEDRGKSSTARVNQRQEDETEDLAGIRERHAAEKEKEAYVQLGAL